VLEDGNVDDRALHAALPVNKGEKWYVFVSYVFVIGAYVFVRRVSHALLCVCTLTTPYSLAGSRMYGFGILLSAGPTTTVRHQLRYAYAGTSIAASPVPQTVLVA
jgi:hypothetical protein